MQKKTALGSSMKGTRLKGELEEKLDNTSRKVDTQHYRRLYY